MTERGRCNREVVFTKECIVQEQESESKVSITAFKFRNKRMRAKGLGAKEANSVLNENPLIFHPFKDQWHNGR